MKPFDMFVFVNEGMGSTALKRLENPAHDNFEFNRIIDADDSEEIKRRYDLMQNEIRRILLSKVSTDSSNEVQLSELSKILFDLGASDDKDANTERGETMFISSGSPPKQKLTIVQDENNNEGSDTTNGSSEGKQKGQTGGTKETGNKPGDGKKKVTVEGSESETNSSKSKSQANNLRINRTAKDSSNALVSFTSKLAGVYTFELTVVGESESSKVHLMYNNKKVEALRVNVSSPGRQFLEVEVANKDDLNFAMEGWLNEI